MNWRKKISYPLINKLQKSNELEYLDNLEQSQYYSTDKLNSIRIEKLQSLVKSVFKYVPYYAELFNKYSIDIESIKSLSDLEKIPLLGKKVVQENFETLKASNINADAIYIDYSGGSTGEPTKFLYTIDHFQLRMAALKRHNRWASFDIGEKLAIVWGARRDISKKKTLKQKIWSHLTTNNYVYDTSSITDENIVKFIKDFNKFKPKIVQTYAQSFEFIANYIVENNLKIHSPKSVITSAELLTDSNRELIESVFETTVFDRYGARETSVIASECEYHNMHVWDEGLIVEIIGEDGQVVENGIEGEIVITDLHNHSFPLIRYRIGDTGMSVKNNCKCGRSLSTIKMSSGRISNFLITPRNRKVSGAAITAYVCTNIEGLNKVQFYQKDKDNVLVKVIPNKKYSGKTLVEFRKRIKYFLDDIEPEIQIVEHIEVPESGKHQFVINELLK